MILESIKYIRQKGKQNEWVLSGKDDGSVYFSNTNLIVGKNAAGKTRTLTVISEMANILSLKGGVNRFKHSDWECDLTLKEKDDIYSYRISVKDKAIEDEALSINGIEKYNRKAGRIFSEQNKDFVAVTLSNDEFVVSLREKEEDFPYLSGLYEWGIALKRFTFTDQFDKDHLLTKSELNAFEKLKPENTIQLFHEGEGLFHEKFTDAIKADMGRLNYSTSIIALEECDKGIGISVKEDELYETTMQNDMSQGMFRALSFIINLNYALLMKESVCLLVDDLGEGLDFSRSKSLIDLLIRKINDSDIQMFITTNDRYVMNSIPIKYWSILDRGAKSSVFYNYRNSKDIFDDFKYTGLNNFDFLVSDFYLHGFENEEEKE